MKIKLNFQWQWLLLTCCAFAISLLLVEVGERPDLGWREGLICGVLVGCAQSLILNQRLRQTWRWVLVCALSWCLMASMGWGAIGWFTPRTNLIPLRIFFGLLWGGLAGIVLGLGQALVLKTSISLPERWIKISMYSWAIGLAFGWTIGEIIYSFNHLFLSEVIGLAITWIVVALITGNRLVNLFRESV